MKCVHVLFTVAFRTDPIATFQLCITPRPLVPISRCVDRRLQYIQPRSRESIDRQTADSMSSVECGRHFTMATGAIGLDMSLYLSVVCGLWRCNTVSSEIPSRLAVAKIRDTVRSGTLSPLRNRWLRRQEPSRAAKSQPLQVPFRPYNLYNGGVECLLIYRTYATLDDALSHCSKPYDCQLRSSRVFFLSW